VARLPRSPRLTTKGSDPNVALPLDRPSARE
jgi:hypothetical protein